MSRVLVVGVPKLMEGPWQYSCPHCCSVVELTIDMKVSPDDSSEYWLCPGCGEELYKYAVMKGER